MGKGFVDWDVPVNISAQELAEVTNRPKYGASQAASGTAIITTTALTTLFTISGKGMIYGGRLVSTGNVSHSLHTLKLYVDGELVLVNAFSELLSYNTAIPFSTPFYLMNYNDVDFVYAAGFNYGYTFESSIVLQYGRTETGTFPVYYILYYALI